MREPLDGVFKITLREVTARFVVQLFARLGGAAGIGIVIGRFL